MLGLLNEEVCMIRCQLLALGKRNFPAATACGATTFLTAAVLEPWGLASPGG